MRWLLQGSSRQKLAAREHPEMLLILIRRIEHRVSLSEAYRTSCAFVKPIQHHIRLQSLKLSLDAGKPRLAKTSQSLDSTPGCQSLDSTAGCQLLDSTEGGQGLRLLNGPRIHVKLRICRL